MLRMGPSFLQIPVAIRPGELPVPIPNTKVKPRAAESTLLETTREDRWLPDFYKRNRAEARAGHKGSSHFVGPSL